MPQAVSVPFRVCVQRIFRFPAGLGDQARVLDERQKTADQILGLMLLPCGRLPGVDAQVSLSGVGQTHLQPRPVGQTEV